MYTQNYAKKCDFWTYCVNYRFVRVFMAGSVLPASKQIAGEEVLQGL